MAAGTVNDGFKISDSAAINLSIGYNADRTGKIYKKALNPDTAMDSPDNFSNIESDAKIKAAAKWLASRQDAKNQDSCQNCIAHLAALRENGLK